MTQTERTKMLIKFEEVRGCSDHHSNSVIETFSVKSSDKTFLRRSKLDVGSESDYVSYFESATIADVCGVKFLMVDNGCGDDDSKILIPMAEVEEVGINLI